MTTSDLAGINAQAGDISFMIGYAQTLPNTDRWAVAVAGFSWGGISNLFAAARDNRIRDLVTLDEHALLPWACEASGRRPSGTDSHRGRSRPKTKLASSPILPRTKAQVS